MSIYKDEQGMMLVRAVDAAEEAASSGAAKDKQRTQFVINQTRETWNLWKEYVRPEDCLMRVSCTSETHSVLWRL